MDYFPQFESRICTSWHLYNHGDDHEGSKNDRNDQARNAPKRGRVFTHPLDKLPADHGDNVPDVLWEGSTRRIVFITDCKPLAGVVNGTTALTDQRLAPMFERITSNIFKVIQSGWRPARDIDDMICWQQGAWNVRADYLANYTMDERKSWFQAGDIDRGPFDGQSLGSYGRWYAGWGVLGGSLVHRSRYPEGSVHSDHPSHIRSNVYSRADFFLYSRGYRAGRSCPSGVGHHSRN